MNKKAKKLTSKRKAKHADRQQIAEYVSNLRELHKLQGALLKKLDSVSSAGELKGVRSLFSLERVPFAFALLLSCHRLSWT